MGRTDSTGYYDIMVALLLEEEDLFLGERWSNLTQTYLTWRIDSGGHSKKGSL